MPVPVALWLGGSAMHYQLRVFETEDHREFRTVSIDGEPWFVLADVGRALNYADKKGYYGHHVDRLSSSSMVGQQMAVSFGIKLDDSLVNGAVEVIRAGEGLMSEVMPLQVAPDPFNIVQLRGVFRQPLDREPVGAPRGQRGLPYSCGSGRCRGQARRA